MSAPLPDAVLWDVVSVVKVTDGDTVRVIRSRVVNLDGRHYRLTDEDPAGTAIRLMWVDTPERGAIAWSAAREDLRRWLADVSRRPRLRVLCYESGGWDRIMGDLIDGDGNSASQWMMTAGNGGAGWPPYVP